jgi:hypothetical protein
MHKTHGRKIFLTCFAIEHIAKIECSNRSKRRLFSRKKVYRGRENSGRHGNKSAENRLTIGNEFDIRKRIAGDPPRVSGRRINAENSEKSVCGVSSSCRELERGPRK